MSTTLQTNELTLRTSIIQKINLIFNDEEYTFEAFILMKGNHILKKFVLYEGVPQRRNDTSVNFKKKLQLSSRIYDASARVCCYISNSPD